MDNEANDKHGNIHSTSAADPSQIEQDNLPDALKVSEMIPEQILKLRMIKLGDGRVCDIHILERSIKPSLRSLSGWGFRDIPNNWRLRGNPYSGGGVADSGYIGIDESLKYVLASQAETIKRLGTTNKEVVRRLDLVRDAIISSRNGFNKLLTELISKYADNIPEEELNECRRLKNELPIVEFFTPNGNKKTVKIILPSDRVMNIQSPFQTELWEVEDFQLEDETGTSCLVSRMHRAFIAEYGFYESQTEPILHSYSNLPEIVVILGATDILIEEARQINNDVKIEFAEVRSNNQASRAEIFNNSAMQTFLITIGDKTQLRTTLGWRKYLSEKKEVSPQSFWLPEVTNLVEELSRKGVDIGDYFCDYWIDKYNRFPGETNEETQEYLRGVGRMITN